MHDLNAHTQLPLFYAVQQSKWGRDRTFRVHVNEQMLAGAWIAGHVRDEASFQLDMGGHHWALNWLFRRQWQRLSNRRIERESFYDTVDPFRANLTQLDRRNFQIEAPQVDRMRFEHKRITEVPNSLGVLEVRTFDGTSRRLAVVGDQHPDTIVERLRALHYRVEVEGETPFRSMPERTLWFARHDLIQGGIAALCLGAAAAVVWALGIINDSRVLRVSIICVVGGAALLFRAWKMPNVNRLAEDGSA